MYPIIITHTKESHFCVQSRPQTTSKLIFWLFANWISSQSDPILEHHVQREVERWKVLCRAKRHTTLAWLLTLCWSTPISFWINDHWMRVTPAFHYHLSLETRLYGTAPTLIRNAADRSLPLFSATFFEWFYPAHQGSFPRDNQIISVNDTQATIIYWQWWSLPVSL